jgi:hypothetical protein
MRGDRRSWLVSLPLWTDRASRALEDDALEEAVTRLREAVGLEERH